MKETTRREFLHFAGKYALLGSVIPPTLSALMAGCASTEDIRLPDLDSLVKVTQAVKRSFEDRGEPRMLHLADAVIGLEGEGPSAAGNPKQVGALAASFDAVALDAVLTRLVSWEVDSVLTTPIATSRGLGVSDLESIEIVGDDLDQLSVKGFEPCRRSLRSGSLPASGWPGVRQRPSSVRRP